MKIFKRTILGGILSFALFFMMANPVLAKKSLSATLQEAVLSVGEQTKIKTNNKAVEFRSSDSAIAVVNAQGVVTAKKAGTVKIWAFCKGYKEKNFTLKVKKEAYKPDKLPVAIDEVTMSKQKITGTDTKNPQFSAVIKNNAKKGKIKKIEYYYEIQVYTEEIRDKDSALEPEETQNPEGTQSPEVNYKKETKEVVLCAKNIKPGKSVTASCQGDISGNVSSMQLIKIKLCAGKAKYVYDAASKESVLSWYGKDKKAPIFSGWLKKESYYGKDTIRVCYSDRKNTYTFRDHVKAVDDRDGKVKIKVDTGKINWKKDGIYKVYYTAADKAGNQAKSWAKVQVYVKSQTEVWTDTILNSILKKNWSDEKKVRAIYNYVKSHCSYVGSGTHSDWRKAAVNGFRKQSGDCFTYYAMSRLLMTRAGIPNLMVSRYPAKVGHQHWWNLVYVRNGWYHFDTTPRMRKGYFCLQTDAQLRIYSTGNTFSFRKDILPERAVKVISKNPV